MMGMGFLKLNRVLAKHKWTTGSDRERQPARQVDADEKLLRVAALGVLLPAATALFSGSLVAHDLIVFATLTIVLSIAAPAAIFAVLMSGEHNSIRRRVALVLLAVTAVVAAIAFAVNAAPRLALFLYVFATYLAAVGGYALWQIRTLPR